MSMFDNYNNIPEDYIPDNRIRFLTVDNEYKDTIIIGGTCEHVFIIDMDFNTDISDAYVTYKQGTEYKLIKNKSEMALEVVTESGELPYTIVSVTLTPEETSLFNSYNRDLDVQMKLILTNGDIIYTRIYKILPLPSLKTDIESGE